jgi:opacity protein-like surface antigen
MTASTGVRFEDDTPGRVSLMLTDERRAMKRVFSAAFAMLLFGAVSASAQSLGPRAYVAAQSGLTFGTETDATFGGELGGHITKNLQVYGNVSRMQNTLPKYVNQSLEVLSAEMTAETGLPWSFRAKAPAWMGLAGVRYVIPTSHKVQPYVLGGAGFARTKMTLTEIDLGDVTNDLVSSGFISNDDITMTKGVFELGGGMQFPVSAFYLDAGYRFSKMIDAEDFNTSRAYFGIGARF